MKKFAEWLKVRDPKLAEASTSTADVAVVPTRLFTQPVKRKWPDEKKK